MKYKEFKFDIEDEEIMEVVNKAIILQEEKEDAHIGPNHIQDGIKTYCGIFICPDHKLLKIEWGKASCTCEECEKRYDKRDDDETHIKDGKTTMCGIPIKLLVDHVITHKAGIATYGDNTCPDCMERYQREWDESWKRHKEEEKQREKEREESRCDSCGHSDCE